MTGKCLQNSKSSGENINNIIGNNITCNSKSSSLNLYTILLYSAIIIACIIGGIILLVLTTMIIVGTIVAVKKRISSRYNVLDIMK